jgi:hypothetical protein
MPLFRSTTNHYQKKAIEEKVSMGDFEGDYERFSTSGGRTFGPFQKNSGGTEVYGIHVFRRK